MRRFAVQVAVGAASAALVLLLFSLLHVDTTDPATGQSVQVPVIDLGAGGGVRGAFPKNSLAMARRRLQEAEEVGAEVVLTECNSCVHNLSNAKLRKQKLRICSTTQFINELMEAKEG